jgi:hypothetical protein
MSVSFEYGLEYRRGVWDLFSIGGIALGRISRFSMFFISLLAKFMRWA